jgi:RHS repeat-associated protein
MDRLQQVKENGTEIASYTYDNNGNQITKSIGNGTLSVSYTYNNANQILTLNNKKGSNTLSSFSYTYYLDGSQASKTDNTGKTTSYAYDGLGRLTTESETNLAKTYSYDNANNRSQMDVTGNDPYSVGYAYDYNNRLIQEIITGSANSNINIYSYDNNGNQISKIKSVYDSTGTDPALGLFQIGTEEATGTYEAQLNQYDVFNRLTQTQGNGINALYQYRPDGLRHSKTVNGETTTHIWDNSNIVLDLDGSSQVQNKYLRGNNLVALENNSARSYYLHNAHGDVVQLTNNSGTVTKDYTFDAFGIEEEPDGTDINPFRYAGEYTDKETGNVYLRARYYDPAIGRFMSPDSHWNQANMVYGDNLSENSAPSITSILQSGNLYVYAMNNPIVWIDPLGLYNRLAAAQYAYDFGRSYNPDYLAMDTALAWIEYFYLYQTRLGSDCANYTSQALVAGGLEMNDQWYYYKVDNKIITLYGTAYFMTPEGNLTYRGTDYKFSANWSMARNQYEYFSNPQNGYINGDVIVINNPDEIPYAINHWGIQAGDLMFFANDTDGIHHATMITEVNKSNDEIKYSAHTRPRQGDDLKLNMGSERVHIIRIKDSAK